LRTIDLNQRENREKKKYTDKKGKVAMGGQEALTNRKRLTITQPSNLFANQSTTLHRRLCHPTCTPQKILHAKALNEAQV